MGPWRRPDGVAIAADVLDLLDGRLEAPIEVDELGQHREHDVWTGSHADGESSGEHCGSWLGTGTGWVGDAAGSHEFWSQANSIACTADARLYCFSDVLVLFADGFERGGTREWGLVAP